MVKILNNTIFKASNESEIRCELHKPQSEFPHDLFTLAQRQNGFILIHFLVAIYAIVTAEHICDEYFMPSLEFISFKKLKLSPHVAGATILAFASSFSELSTSIVGVFFAKNDIALHTLIGSGAYNLLIITAICSFCVYKLNIKLEKYPVFRDGFFYLVSTLTLYILLYKNHFIRLYFYDDFILISIFLLFLLTNIFDKKLNQLFKCLMNRECLKKTVEYVPNNSMEEGLRASEIVDLEVLKKPGRSKVGDELSDEDDSLSSNSNSSHEYEEPYNFFKAYKNFMDLKLLKKLFLMIVFPARLFAYVAILDFRRFDKMRNLVLCATFVSSLFFIGCCSFLLVWMVVVISETFGVSESVVGFTFIAAATSMEETVTSISLCRRELRRAALKRDNLNRLNMALSNCIGSNVFDLCIGVGLPYFLNSVFVSKSYFTNVYNQNVSFTVFGLVFCMIGFFGLLIMFKWTLKKKFGLALLGVWSVYVSLVILNDLKLIRLDFFKFDSTQCFLI